MQRKTGVIVLGVILVVAGYVAVSHAQEGRHVPMMGTVTFRDGRTVEGDVRLLAFGVVESAKFGSSKEEVDEGGRLEIDVDGEKKTIPGPDIATVEAQWQNLGTEDQPDWKITSLTVTTRDGQTVTGMPAWFLSMTEVKIDPGEGKSPVWIQNYPVSDDFDPNNLVVKANLTAPAPAEEPTPAPEPEKEEVPPVPPVPSPVVEPPAEEKPAEEEPTEEKPGEEKAAEEGPPAVAVPVVPAPPAPERGPAPASLTLTITCPHCGEKIVIVIDAHVP